MTKAFAFDIDGVLLRGGLVLPGAKKALELLNIKRIPWILLTNGGGKLEKDRVAELSQKLSVRIEEKQFLQSHTPFRDFVGNTDRILAVGGRQDRVKEIAQNYGFKDVVIPREVAGTVPEVSPFPSWTSTLVGHQPLARKLDLSKPFDAVFVFHDTFDMSFDSQIVIDLLLSKDGRLGTRVDPSKYSSKPSIPIYFSNGDLQWATDYALSRFGQGAFIKTVTGLYEAVTEGHKLTHTVIGKPTILTYEYAHKLLQTWASEQGRQIEKVFMIGDNQYSDIKGANAFGWESVLVKTGVYKEGDSKFTKPTFIEDGVLQAVERALEF